MSEKEKKPVRYATIRLYVEEYDQLYRLFQQTTDRKFAQFLRDRLMARPMIRKYRNQSLDDLNLSLIGIKTELETLRRRYTEAVQHLKTMPPDTAIADAITDFMQEEGQIREQLGNYKQILIKIYDKCSQVLYRPQEPIS